MGGRIHEVRGGPALVLLLGVLGLLGVLLVGTAGPAGATQPRAIAVPAGTLDGRSRLTVDMPGDDDPGALSVTVDGRRQATEVVPLVSNRTATVVVVDASADGTAQLQAGLSGVTSLVLAAPDGARTALVTDTDPPAVVSPLGPGPSDTVRGLATVRPAGTRQTAAALDLAVHQLPPGPDDPRLVVLYTGAPDAGGPAAADLAGRLTATGAVLAVVVPTPEVPPYWAEAATATGGVAVAARTGVVGAFDELAAVLRTRCLVTFPAPRILPVAAVVRADTPQGPVTADAVVPPPASPAQAQGAGSGRTAGAVVGTVIGLVLLAAVGALVWGVVQSGRRRTEPAAAADGSAWSVPDRPAHVVPRSDLRAALHAAMRAGRPAVLRGAAGRGATTAMIEFAHETRSEHDIVWWVPAADPPLVADRLAELAEALGLAAPTDPAEEAVERLLAALRNRDRWLLVLDDAASPRQLARFLPGGPGRVLVASDDPGWDDHATPVQVGPFRRHESVTVLRGRRPGLSDTEADRVAAMLADVPLAVDLAGATLAATGASPAGYLRQLAETGLPDRSAAACALAVDRLAIDHPAAADLLKTLAWLGPDPVPFSLPARSGPAQHPGRVADLAAVLQARGLADVGDGTVRVHPTTAGIARGRGGGANRAAAAVRLLGAAVPDDPGSPAWRALLPHVLVVTDPARRLDDVTLDVGRLLLGAGSYLRTRGEPRAARALFEDAHRLYRRRLGADHPDTRFAARTLADDLEVLGEHELARRLRGEAGGPRRSAAS